MSDYKHILISKINKRKAAIAVIGLGYVGLPLAVEFAKRGFSVLGIDTDRNKLTRLKKGISHIHDIDSQVLKQDLIKRHLSFDSNYKHLKTTDIIIICVPTPLRKTKEPDISYVVKAAQNIKENFKKGQLIILESTTFPGTTEEILLPMFSQHNWKVGRDFFLVFSPERIDPGNKDFNTSNITKVIGGITRNCTKLAKLIYSQIVDRIVTVSSSRVAEMTKLLENTFRAVNIGLINEMALMCEKLDIDIWEVIEAAKTKPFGFMPFYPGPGLGGHCLPVDPLYLTWKSKLHGFEPRLIEIASQINSYMPRHIVKRSIELISQKLRKPIFNAKILVIGVTYKKDVGDIRESPAIDIIRMLIRRQCKVFYHDPFVPKLSFMEGKTLLSQKLTKQNISDCDCVIIVTDHSGIDYDLIQNNARLIFDTRNVLKKRTDKKKNIFFL